MVKLIRDYYSLSKPKKIAVGVVNTIIAIVIIFVSDSSMGVKTSTTIVNIIITLIAGAIFLMVYGQIAKWHEQRKSRPFGSP